MTKSSHVVTSLEVDGFHHNTATLQKGDNIFLDLHGASARNLYAGLHYFIIQYHTIYAFSFTDYKEKYTNKNLHAMMLAPSCSDYCIQPKTMFPSANPTFGLQLM